MFSIYLFKPNGIRVFQCGAGSLEEADDALTVLKAQFPDAEFRIL